MTWLQLLVQFLIALGAVLAGWQLVPPASPVRRAVPACEPDAGTDAGQPLGGPAEPAATTLLRLDG